MALPSKVLCRLKLHFHFICSARFQRSCPRYCWFKIYDATYWVVFDRAARIHMYCTTIGWLVVKFHMIELFFVSFFYGQDKKGYGSVSMSSQYSLYPRAPLRSYNIVNSQHSEIMTPQVSCKEG